jgi:lipid-binding SYLF domain-containing protein
LPKYLAALLFSLAGTVASARSTMDAEPTALLKGTTQVLTELSDRPASTVPDAVLNRTQCVVVIQAGTTRLRPGTAACRETSDRWNNPILVTFEEAARSNLAATLLIFISKDAAVKALRSGSLEIATYKDPVAPIAPKNAIPSEHELNRDLFTYEYTRGRLAGRRVHGIVRYAKNKADTDHDITHAATKITRKYLSSITSFFNMIIPTGIVIHHTAVLPDEDAPPRNERQIDKYHATRGFEITCFGHVYHVAYHYLVLTNGRIQTGRPDRCEGAHAKGYNSYLGISVVGDFDSRDNPKGEKGPEKPNEKQMAPLIRLCRRLMLRYHIRLKHVVRHSDTAVTKCPGDRFPFFAFLKQLQSTTVKNSNRPAK